MRMIYTVRDLIPDLSFTVGDLEIVRVFERLDLLHLVLQFHETSSEAV